MADPVRILARNILNRKQAKREPFALSDLLGSAA